MPQRRSLKGAEEDFRVLVSTSGSDSELEKTVPITRASGEERRVVMRLSSGGKLDRSLPDLQPGDLLEVSAELEVTTDCEKPEKRNCVGSAYSYAPTAEVSLILAARGDETDGKAGQAVRMDKVKTVKCSHAEHHKMIIFVGAIYRIPDDPPEWMGQSPSVNLVLSATHPKAKPGELLLVGENEPGATVNDPGGVGGDKGRISAVRTRGREIDVPNEVTTRRRSAKVPIDTRKKTVLFSLPVKDLAEGEQLAIAASIPVRSGLSYPARFSARMFLADSENAIEPKGQQDGIASFGGEISEDNGQNWLPGAGHQVARKLGVLGILKSPGKPMYINVVAVGGDPLDEEGTAADDAIEVLDGGQLRALRYPPQFRG